LREQFAEDKSGVDAVAGGVTVRSMMWPDCSLTDACAAFEHHLQDVLVADIRAASSIPASRNCVRNQSST